MSYYAPSYSFSPVLESGSSPCFCCNHIFNNIHLNRDDIYIDKKICRSCYFIRKCEKCFNKFKLSDMLEGDYNTEFSLVCKPCSKYTRDACDKCKCVYYTHDLQLTSDGEICEDCIETLRYDSDES